MFKFSEFLMICLFIMLTKIFLFDYLLNVWLFQAQKQLEVCILLYLVLIWTYLCGFITSQGVSQVSTKRAFPDTSFTRQNYNLVLHGGQLQLDLLYSLKKRIKNSIRTSQEMFIVSGPKSVRCKVLTMMFNT